MAAGWRAPVFSPADDLRSKTDAYEGTWTIMYDYEDGLPNFVYSETYPNAAATGKWSIARCTAFVTRAKAQRTNFNATRNLVAACQAEINAQIVSQGA